MACSCISSMSCSSESDATVYYSYSREKAMSMAMDDKSLYHKVYVLAADRVVQFEIFFVDLIVT